MDHVYCSPSLRCVQTAQNILKGEPGGAGWARASVGPAVTSCDLLLRPKGLQQEGKVKMRVEPGLFEWTKWVSGSSLPAWAPPADLAAAHFSVDTSYR